MRIRAWYVAALAALLSCTAEPVAVDNAVDESQGIKPAVRLPVSNIISDGRTTGDHDFYFLWPIVPDKAPRGGAFDAGAQPTVTVCRLVGTSCAETVAEFPYSDKPGLGLRTTRQYSKFEFYLATWLTPSSKAGQRYRVSVRAYAITLGFADLRLVRHLGELRSVPPDEVGVISGFPLPVVFRIDMPSVTAPPISDCPECLFPVKLISQLTSTPVSESLTFPADATADYILDIDLGGATGTAGTVELNGGVALNAPPAADGMPRHLQTSLTLGSSNTIVARINGRPGSYLLMRVRRGRRLGTDGGTVNLAGGAVLEFPEGALPNQADITAAPVGIDHAGVIPLVAGSAWALGPDGSVFAKPVRLTLTFDPNSLPPGTDPSRIRIYKLSGGHLFEQSDIRIDVAAHRVSALLKGFSTYVAAVSTPPACLPLPPVAAAPQFAPCDQVALDLLSKSTSANVASTAVVLIHGWSRDEDDWMSYYYLQGIVCPMNTATGQPECIVDPSIARSLPASTYFSALHPALARDLPGADIWAASYESWKHVAANGALLASEIDKKLSGYRSVILVAHSMGGLVARSALATTHVPVSALVTLGTPHNGSPLADYSILGSSFSCAAPDLAFPGIGTDGGRDLNKGLGPYSGTVPLIAFAGDLTREPAGVYAPGYRCLQSLGYPHNDGVVPMASATASGSTTEIPTRTHDYTHGQLVDGKTGNISSEPYYIAIVSDLRSIIASIPATVALLRPSSGTVISQNQSGIGCPVHPSRGSGFRISFQWSDVGATSYNLRAEHLGATAPLVNVATTGTSFDFTSCNSFVAPGNEDNWQWSVQPVFNGQPGEWAPSSTFSFSPCLLGDGSACSALPAGETLLLSEQFANGLANWTIYNPDGNGRWFTQNGELFGDYNIGCGNPSCQQTQLLLNSQFQPTGNWRMVVKSGLTQAYCCFNGGAMVNLAKFTLYVSPNERESFDLGATWQGLTAPSSWSQANAYHQAFPWHMVGSNTVTVPAWSPSEWQTARLEKIGNQYTLYFNDMQVYQTTRTFSAPPQIGFTTYGGVRMDDFQLYSLP